MRRRPAGLAAFLLFFFLSFRAGLAADGGSIALTAAPPPYPSVTRPIFPTNVREIDAAVTLPGADKASVEFVWSSPDGKVYSDTVKIIYPLAGGGPTIGRDAIKVAGEGPSKSPGWWTVEAVFGDRKLSARFLLTDNRQLIAIAHGNTGQKLLALANIDLKAEGSEEALRIAYVDTETKVRVAAMKAMTGSAVGWAVGLLEKGQEDVVPAVRTAVLRALLAAGGDVAAGAAEKACVDSSRLVRKALVEELAKSDAAWTTPMLGRILMDKDGEIRAAALGELARRSGPDAVKALSVGREVEDGQFRRDVFRVLAGKSGPGRADALIPWLKDPDPGTRLMALKEVAAAAGPDAPGAIRPLTADKSEAVAEAAVDALYGLGDAAGVAFAAGSGTAEVRKKAVSLLVKMKGPVAVDGLVRAIKDEDVEVRRAALKGLIQAGGAGVPGLLTALSDSDTEIRRDAVDALAALGTDEAERGMAEALKDRDPSIREKAAGYFIHRGGPGIPSVLASLACDSSPVVRSMGLAVLVRMPGEESSKALSAYFSCGDVSARETVVDVLSSRGDPAALECLNLALKDKEAGVRLKAAAALLAAGVKAPLAALAEDPDPGVRRVALTAMSEAPSSAMLPVLKKLAADPDEGVRLLCLDVLKGIPGEESGAVISGAVSDTSAAVRGAARDIVLSRRDAGVVDGLYRLSVANDARALDTLAAIPGDAADQAMLGVFRKGPRGQKVTALRALSKRGGEVFYKAEMEAAGDEGAELGLAALDMAGLLPDARREALYLSAMSSKSAEVREAAIPHLAALGSEKARAALMNALDDPAPVVRRSALTSLARIKEKALAGRLTALVNDRDLAVRAAALDAAMRLDDDVKRADALVAAVYGPYPDVAGSALDGLLPMGDPRALDAFARAFEAGHRRDEVLRGMALVKGGQAVKYLAQAYRLAKDDGRLRLFAVRELAGRGPAALPALTEATGDPDQEVRLEALQAVLAFEMPGPDRLAILKRALADPYLEVRRQALYALGKTEGIDAAHLMFAALADKELCDPALGLLLERREPGIITELAALAPGINDPAFRARVVGAVFDRGLSASDALKFMDDPATGVRAETVRALAGRSGADAAYGLFVLGGEPEFAEAAAKGLLGRSPEEQKAGLTAMFGKGQATVRTVGFAAGILKDPGLLVFIVESIPASDTAMMKAALRPVIDGLAPYGLPAALKGMKSDDPGLRQEIAAAVAGTDCPETGAALREIYTTRPELRAVLFDAAVRNGREMELLPLAIKDPDESLRARAAELAVRRGYHEGVHQAASDSSARIRKTAAVGLADESGRDVPEVLGRLALDPDEGVASAALSSLEGLGGRVPPSVWADIAGSPGARTPQKRAAVKAIAKRGGAAYASVLAIALADEDMEVRDTARDGLLSLGKDGLGVLHGLTGDGKVGLAALGLLIEIGDRSSERFIISALPKMDLKQRLLAVDALSKLGGPASLGPLAGLYREGPEQLRKKVLKALGNLRLKGYEPALVEVLGDGLSSKDEEMEELAARDTGVLRVTSLMARLEKGPPAGSPEALKDAYKDAFETLRAEHGMLVYRMESDFRAAKAAGSADAYPILMALYEDYDAETRARAVRALGEEPADKAGPLIMKALGDNSAVVRRAAGELVLSRAGEGVLAGLTEIAVSGEPDLAMKAVSALQGMQGARTEGALKEVLKKGGPDERLAAFSTLGERDTRPMPEVVADALDDPSPAVRGKAAEILSGRKGADAVFGLLVLGGGDDAALRKQVEKALSGRGADELMGGINALFEKGRAKPGSVGLAARLGVGGEAEARMVDYIKPGDTALLTAALGPAIARRAPSDLPAIVKGFKAEDPALKDELVAALAGLGTTEAALALREIYAGHAGLRRKLLTAADENHRAVEILPLGCKDPDEAVRAFAVGLAVKVRYEECVKGAAGDSSVRIRKMAAEGLAAGSGDDTVKLLVKLAEDEDGQVSEAALASLSVIGEGVPSESWATLAGKGRGAVRLAALKALATRKDSRYASVLAGALADEDPEARKVAEEGLAAEGKGALDVLNRLVTDEKLRPVVLDLLGDIADPSSEGPILSVFPALDMPMKLVAAGVLGKLGGPSSLVVLVGLYKDGGPEARAAALRAVEGLRLKGDEKELVELLKDALANGSDNAKFRAARMAGRLRVAQLADSLEKGPGPGASSLLEEEYRKSLMLIKGQGQGTAPTSP